LLISENSGSPSRRRSSLLNQSDNASLGLPGLGLRRLFASSGIYFLASAGQQAVGFLLLPLYTSVLSPADYGVLEIINTTGLIAVMVLSLGLPSAIMKCYHRDCRSDSDRRSLLATSLAVELPVLLAGCFLIYVNADRLASGLLGPGHPGFLFRLMAAWVFLNATLGIILALFRSREEAALLGTVTLGMFVLLMFLNIYFVWALRLGVQGVLMGNCISTATAILVGVVLLRSRATIRINPALIGPLMGFGLLIVPAALSGWVMGMADRYLLKFYGQLAAVGVYSLGYKLGMVMEVLIVSPFQLAWPPFSFAISENHDHKQVYARTLTYLTLASSMAVLGLSLLSPIVLRYATHPDYFKAATVVPLIALAYAFNGVHYCVSPGIHLRRRTQWLPVLVATAAVLNVVLCVLLIPRIGMLGAAWATTASFAVLAASTFTVAQALYPVAYEYGRLVRIVGAATMVYAANRWLPFEHPAGQAAAAMAWLVVVFPSLLLASGFLAVDEKAAITQLLRRNAVNRPLNVPVGTAVPQPRTDA
jgi:O-antigen/teichoic acid export membrane protein